MSDGEVTRLLNARGADGPDPSGRLVAIVYDELRRLAEAKMAREAPGQTLDATGLVHEAFLRLAGGARWDSRGHFYAAASEAMRRILVENARRKKSLKRGGGRPREPLDADAIAAPEACDDLIALDEALSKFEAIDPPKAALVKLRYFSGLTIPEAAEALGIAPSTADRWWSYARAWLRVEVGGSGG